MAWCHSFCLFSYFIAFIHSIDHTHTIHLSVSICRLSSLCKLSGKTLPVVPSRESNPGLPYSKPTRYQLSHAAPWRWQINYSILWSYPKFHWDQTLFGLLSRSLRVMILNMGLRIITLHQFPSLGSPLSQKRLKLVYPIARSEDGTVAKLNCVNV